MQIEAGETEEISVPSRPSMGDSLCLHQRASKISPAGSLQIAAEKSVLAEYSASVSYLLQTFLFAE